MKRLALLAAVPALAAAAPPKLPDTPKKPVVDTYFGQKVRDDYRWLEDWNDPAVKAWSDAENQVARAWLDALPERAAVRARTVDLIQDKAPRWQLQEFRGGLLFASEMRPPRDQPMVVAFAPGDLAHPKKVLDPLELDPTGHTSYDWAVPSLDGKYLAASISKGGSEDGTLWVFDVATGKPLPDRIERVQYGTGGGSVAWTTGGFFYTRYPRDGERAPEDMHAYQQLWFHQLGAPAAKDVYVLGKDFPRIAEIEVKTSRDGRFVTAAVLDGDGGDRASWVTGPDPGAHSKWSQVSTLEDKVVDMDVAPDGTLVLLSRHDAPKGKVLATSAAAPSLASAKLVVPATDRAISGVTAVGSTIYVREMVGGPSQLRRYDASGADLGLIPTMDVARVEPPTQLAGDDVLFYQETFTQPGAYWHYAPDKPLEKTPLAYAPPISMDDIEVTREVAVSKDGTQVPMTILRKKGAKRDGQTPTILNGYGGYGISMEPGFRLARRVWLEAGGLYVIANLRGGGEFGDAWHTGGNLTRKQHVFDDFAACARRLIELKITRPAKLAALGGSNGGLLMGAALTQHPELFRAVVSTVGIYDMLRVETSPNGSFNVTEFGTVKDKAQFEALYAYSPYHHVVEGKTYPHILFMTGANDPRVDPMNSRKMTARLQAATAGEKDARILLRTSGDTGHGIGTPLAAVIEESADLYAFLFHELGVRPPTASTN